MIHAFHWGVYSPISCTVSACTHAAVIAQVISYSSAIAHCESLVQAVSILQVMEVDSRARFQVLSPMVRLPCLPL